MALGDYFVTYHPAVRGDVSHIDLFWRREISTAIRNKLTTQPDLFGVPLRQSLRGYRKLRVGNYRVVYRIEKNIVRIVAIIHRSEGYREIGKRL